VHKAKKHYPNFVDVGESNKETFEFETVEELLACEWVQSYTRWNEFHNFCRDEDGYSLMLESEDGMYWWVVAYVPLGSIDELPIYRKIYSPEKIAKRKKWQEESDRRFQETLKDIEARKVLVAKYKNEKPPASMSFPNLDRINKIREKP